MVLLQLLFGLATGSLLGLLGGGGSVIAVPILVYVFGLEAKTAIGSSLLIVGLASILAAFSHHRRKYVSLRIALLFGLSGALGSLLGAKLATYLPDRIQLIMFAAIMAFVGVLMFKPRQGAESSPQDAKQLPITLLAGAGAGLLTGLLGVGGGFIIVPTLTLVLGLPIKQAIGTSLLIIGMNSTVGAAAYASRIPYSTSIFPFALATILAAPIAAHFAHYAKQEKLKRSFAIGLLALATWMIIKQLNNPS